MSRANIRSLSLLGALILAPSCAAAGSAALCAAAKQPVQSKPLLAAAVAAAFEKASFNSNAGDCLYPLEVLPYPSAEVLVVQAGEPGEACHGCPAPLSAYVLRKVESGPRLVRVYRTFDKLGTFGGVGNISAIEIGGDDGMAIESGGTFQGYTFTAISFFAFHAGKLISLSEPIMIGADNGGAVGDSDKAIGVAAKWFFDPTDNTTLVVDYKVEAHGAVRAERAVWRLQGTSLVLSHGRIPREVSEASGGG